MHKLIINKLGPIEHCELICSHFMTLTGAQASGKSTIAKTIYFFRTIKDDIVELAKAQALEYPIVNGIEVESCAETNVSLQKKLEVFLREKFMRTFGSSWGMPNDMYMEYYFTETCFIKISLKESAKYPTPNYIWITLSRELNDFLKKRDRCLVNGPLGIPEEELQKLKAELYNVFDDKYTVVYIPAGRSMITLLSQQLNYIYATMDEVQKRSLDSCTRDYLERVLRVKSEFVNGLQGLVGQFAGKTNIPAQIVEQALTLIKKILCGVYRYNYSEEQIVLDDGKYVKINYSSSGQQESVWILNLLFYYLLRKIPILFIVEEPESHLFPESQKYITELIALVSNQDHSIVLTTHSPYVLGTLNNLLYARSIPERYYSEAARIIPSSFWIDHNFFDSWFVKNGSLENGMDPKIHMIQNERIDEISGVINDEFDALLGLQDTDEEGVAL